MNKLPFIALLVGGIAYAQPGGSPPAPAPAPAPSPAPSPAGSPTPVNEPAPSGPGLGVTPAPAPVRTPIAPPKQLTPKEMEELTSVEQDYDLFIQAADQHDKRMRQIARSEYTERTKELERKYAERIAKAEGDKDKLFGNTLARLEKFLQDHPSHEQFTPDAMFRLADIYLTQADDEVDKRLAALDAAPAGAPVPDAASIVADYSKSLALWEDILKRFPNYRQTPSTIYLLAYYGKTKDERRSLQLFLSLACANRYKWFDPPTPAPDKQEAIKRVEQKTLREVYGDCQPYPGAELELVRHAWVRGVADYHFTVPGEIDESIAAYLKVANGGNDSKRDFLEDSIKRFDESVRLYDTTIAAGNTPPLELREESIQYIAVAFTDPWLGETDTDPAKAFDRAKKFYAGRENEAHVQPG